MVQGAKQYSVFGGVACGSDSPADKVVRFEVAGAILINSATVISRMDIRAPSRISFVLPVCGIRIVF